MLLGSVLVSGPVAEAFWSWSGPGMHCPHHSGRALDAQAEADAERQAGSGAHGQLKAELAAERDRVTQLQAALADGQTRAARLQEEAADAAEQLRWEVRGQTSCKGSLLSAGITAFAQMVSSGTGDEAPTQ